MRIIFLVLLLILASCGEDWSQLLPTPTPTPTVLPQPTITPTPTISPVPTPSPTPTPEPEFYTGYIYKEGVPMAPNSPYGLATRKSELPVRFSWVSLGFDIPVRDQGNCGSCWAQSSAGVLEWAQLIYQDKSQMLSTQQLVSCDKSVYGCSGGWFADGYVLKNGLAKEQDFPYQAKNLPCKSGLQAFAKPIDAMNIGENGKPTTEQLKEALMQFGPLSVSVAAGKGWSGFKGGKMSPCTNRGINHMVMIFGWDDSKGGWLMRNSWGKQWGTMGDALMPYGCDRIGEEAAVFLVKPIKEYN